MLNIIYYNTLPIKSHLFVKEESYIEYVLQNIFMNSLLEMYQRSVLSQSQAHAPFNTGIQVDINYLFEFCENTSSVIFGSLNLFRSIFLGIDIVVGIIICSFGKIGSFTRRIGAEAISDHQTE